MTSLKMPVILSATKNLRMHIRPAGFHVLTEILQSKNLRMHIRPAGFHVLTEILQSKTPSE